MQEKLYKERILGYLQITTKFNKIKDKVNSLTDQVNQIFQITKEVNQENRIKLCLFKVESHHLRNH